MHYRIHSPTLFVAVLMFALFRLRNSVGSHFYLKQVGKGKPATHPEPEERLHKFLYSRAIENNETVKMFAAVSMQLQWAAFGHSLSGWGDSIDDVLGGLLDGSYKLL